jgi:hypothetical protein
MTWNMRHIWLPIPWLQSSRHISQKFRWRPACTYLALMVGFELRARWSARGIPQHFVEFLRNCQEGYRHLAIANGQLFGNAQRTL